MHITSGFCASLRMHSLSSLGIVLLALKYKIFKYCVVVDTCARVEISKLVL